RAINWLVCIWANQKNCLVIRILNYTLSSNQSHGEYPDCRSERESGGEASLLVSPLVVAGIVIGLVLFLSCVTIIIGSLHISQWQDGFSYGGSAGELRSSCVEDFPPGLDFDSFGENLPQISNLYPDSPPRGNGAQPCQKPFPGPKKSNHHYSRMSQRPPQYL
uniref:Uncharacterized protein n=1 Tax=Fundulus heteroclitus TaxID=8078 RepID=A0A3Q2T6L2_FUNHE